MRALRLAPALLLALAACTVDTDSLKPKTDAECAATGSKACGPRCVGRNDPATGCGDPGCQPCAAPAGSETFCDPGLRCASRPPCAVDLSDPYRYVRCDPYANFCNDLRNDSNHCGACYHVCGPFSCNSYTCDPGTHSVPTGLVPQSLASDGVSLYWTANDIGFPGPGYAGLYRDGAFQMNWFGRASDLAVDSYGFVAWDALPGAPVLRLGGGSVVPLFTPTGQIRSLAIDPSNVYLTEWPGGGAGEGPTNLVAISRFGSILSSYTFPPADRALTAVAVDPTIGDVVLGTDSGAIRWMAFDGLSMDTYVTGIDPPVALVVFHGYVGRGTVAPSTIAFWLGKSGNLFSMELPAGPVRNLTQDMPAHAVGELALVADSDGVYWVDSAYGMVAEWRALYDDVVVLSWPSSSPRRVAVTGSEVAWLEASGAVRSVAK